MPVNSIGSRGIVPRRMTWLVGVIVVDDPALLVITNFSGSAPAASGAKYALDRGLASSNMRYEFL